MPKGQLLFSAVFGFRNPSKEIFSESDEINSGDLIISGSFQSTGEKSEGCQGGPTPQGGAAKGGRPPGVWLHRSPSDSDSSPIKASLT